jgi:hypothetical protein
MPTDQADLPKGKVKEEKLECSPPFDKLRTVSKVEPLGEPFKSVCQDKSQVKLKLDTTAKLSPSGQV